MSYKRINSIRLFRHSNIKIEDNWRTISYLLLRNKLPQDLVLCSSNYQAYYTGSLGSCAVRKFWLGPLMRWYPWFQPARTWQMLQDLFLRRFTQMTGIAAKVSCFYVDHWWDCLASLIGNLASLGAGKSEGHEQISQCLYASVSTRRELPGITLVFYWPQRSVSVQE